MLCGEERRSGQSAPNTCFTSHRHLCRPCHNREKAKGLGKYVCQRCHLVIDEQPLMFKNDAYHPDHFSCTHCGYVHSGVPVPGTGGEVGGTPTQGSEGTRGVDQSERKVRGRHRGHRCRKRLPPGPHSGSPLHEVLLDTG